MSLKPGKRYGTAFYCFPLVEANDVCDPNANWTCPCDAELQCRDDFNADDKRHSKHYHKKDKYYGHKKYSRDAFYKYRKVVEIKETEECPRLYKKQPKRPKYHRAVCVAVPKVYSLLKLLT